ncbi:MAG: 4Fe-4S binding protein [Ignavibacteriales bacterium]|nr:4Fe-4S binding protein [Ignavibacteriales bacterium]
MKKLLIDIPVLIDSRIPAQKIECEYMFHRKNDGHFSLLEIAQFAVYCRQCKEAFCVEACPKEALERLDSGMIKRYNMRCVGCKSCILACPFGTIFPEVINYITAKCDYCLNQLKENPEYEPSCVKTAPNNSFSMKEIEKEIPKEHLYIVGEHLAIKEYSWMSKEERR